MVTQKSTPETVLKVITKHLDHKPRGAVERRYAAMTRELRFLEERQDEKLAFLRSHRWNDDRLKVLFGLNCIYQEVIGPLDASIRAGEAGMGTRYPIVHGAMRFDRAYSSKVRKAATDFFTLVSKFGFQHDWMTKNTCGDLVYYIAKHEHEEEAGEND
jgi:hypothetical protein